MKTNNEPGVSRRTFMASAAAAGLGHALMHTTGQTDDTDRMGKKPNVVFVFGDQWRGQATGYAGDVNVQTPHLDTLASQSARFTRAVSGQPVCTPYRACFLTGQYPMTHGVFMNDVCLDPDATTLAKVFGAAGYDTSYIGKWHLDGHGRSNFIPPERQQGFDYWRALECTHDYNNSRYYTEDDPTPRYWEGYDAIAQTRDAQRYIREHDSDNPFLLVLSWGPPHDPYHTAPKEYRDRVTPETITLRDNVPADYRDEARNMLAGYYAHCAALDDCIGDLLETLETEGIADDTLFVFTSDHGDLLGSHGARNKQQPYAESIMVPFLLRYPAALGREGRDFNTLFNVPDIMPTLLGLADIPIPDTVEGTDFSAALRTGDSPDVESALILCPAPFGQWSRDRGGREYRGVYTDRYTYTRDLNGPWLLFDNEADPYQLNNLANNPDYAAIQSQLDTMVDGWLARTNDSFKPAAEHIADWGYEVDETGTVPYTP